MKNDPLLVLALLFLVAAGCGQNRYQVRGPRRPGRNWSWRLTRIMEITGTLGGELVKLYNGDGRQPLLRETGGSGSGGQCGAAGGGPGGPGLCPERCGGCGRQRDGSVRRKNPWRTCRCWGSCIRRRCRSSPTTWTGIRKLADLRGPYPAVGAAGSRIRLRCPEVLEAAGIPEDGVSASSTFPWKMR